jgi:hypothetical protein
LFKVKKGGEELAVKKSPTPDEDPPLSIGPILDKN